MKTIAQRELRNHIGRVLRQVEAGERLRITVDGRPVADLVPARDALRTYVSRSEITRLLARAPLDLGFTEDLAEVTGAGIDQV